MKFKDARYTQAAADAGSYGEQNYAVLLVSVILVKVTLVAEKEPCAIFQ